LKVTKTTKVERQKNYKKIKLHWSCWYWSTWVYTLQ